MRGMNILVTGGNGDLGRVLAPVLRERGALMFSLDISPAGREGVETIVGSILDRSLVQDAVSRADIIVHIAA